MDWDGLDQVPIPGDISWPEVAIDASSFLDCPSIFLSDVPTTTATTNNCLGQPSITMVSEGGMLDLDLATLEQLLYGDNPLPWPQVATIASSSPSFCASPSTFHSDATTNWGTTPASSANTCLIQPSIGVPCTTSSEGAVVDLDLLEQLVSPDNAINDSSSHTFFASPSTFRSSDAETTTFPSSANTMWIQPGSSAVRERLRQALSYIGEAQRNKNVLVQVWVPIRTGDSPLVLTTAGQPFTLYESSKRLRQFREVSTHYHFSVDASSECSPVGLTVVYMGKLPQWSPDVQFFTSYKWPRVRYAQDLDVRGTLVLPVFEKGNHSCLGVIELITTARKLNFTSELNAICSALQAVNLTTTEVSSIPRTTKFNSASYKDALPEILQVLKAACIVHKLPLAQTWVTCARQGKWGRRHSDENNRYCISTIDIACYVNDPRMQGFHDACSEHHLLRGQGVVGKAFTTNQPWFLPDVGSSSKLEYPLSHHARIFGLKGAMAIRLRCTRTGTADFVMEFFLPTDCEAENEQNTMLNSLSGTVQSLCRTLRMVTDKEMEDDSSSEMDELNSFGFQKNKTANKRKRMARRSPVWRSFTEVMVGDTVKAKCNHCGLDLCCDSKTHGTSSLANHLKICKLNPKRNTGPI